MIKAFLDCVAAIFGYEVLPRGTSKKLRGEIVKIAQESELVIVATSNEHERGGFYLAWSPRVPEWPANKRPKSPPEQFPRPPWWQYCGVAKSEVACVTTRARAEAAGYRDWDNEEDKTQEDRS